MKLLTSEQLHVIMPLLSRARRETLLPFLQEALDEFAITSASRTAAFLAQLAHESGELRFMEEIWGPTPAQRRYEPVTTLATRLGNSLPGDGKRFKGRGPIQITGRANYRTYGGLLGADLEAEPETAARPELAFRIAGVFWQRNGLNELADEKSAAAFQTITRRINGGLNGLAERERYYAMACTTLNVTPATSRSGATRSTRRSVVPDLERGAEAILRDRSRARRRRR